MRGAAHNVHYVRTDDGMYIIQSPISLGMSFLEAYATAGMGPMIHKEWFMDQLHEGDQILFRASCNKHNDCQFWLPNPDHDGKEYRTLGIFRPDQAKTNTAALCRSGKLRPDVAARVCEVAPAPVAVVAPAPVRVRPVPTTALSPVPVSVASVTPTTPAPPAAAAQVPATPAPAAVPGYLPTPPLYADPKKQ